jgi:DNA polymerase III gamma/tau subunit
MTQYQFSGVEGVLKWTSAATVMVSARNCQDSLHELVVPG